MDNANALSALLRDKLVGCEIWYCVSPMVHDMSQLANKSDSKERIFPSILKAYSDYRMFYKVDKCGVPEIPMYVKPAAHGLIHVDHRLLTKESQCMSIVTCCSLVKSSIFVPPFNKWNEITEEVCKENGIELIKFEDGWLSMEHNDFFPNHYKWYLHSRAFSPSKMEQWITSGG